ncbi:hypothetical protein JCM8547_009001 [Rhodosporidiobolus lusitaniae]
MRAAALFFLPLFLATASCQVLPLTARALPAVLQQKRQVLPLTAPADTRDVVKKRQVLAAAASLDVLERRDQTTDFTAGKEAATQLALDASSAVASGGECTEGCSTMVSGMVPCSTGDELTQATCICQTDVLESATTCGNCLGGDDAGYATSLNSLCSSWAATNYSVSTTSGSATLTGSSTASAATVTVSSEDADGGAAPSFANFGTALLVAAGVAVVVLA